MNYIPFCLKYTASTFQIGFRVRGPIFKKPLEDLIFDSPEIKKSTQKFTPENIVSVVATQTFHVAGNKIRCSQRDPMLSLEGDLANIPDDTFISFLEGFFEVNPSSEFNPRQSFVELQMIVEDFESSEAYEKATLKLLHKLHTTLQNHPIFQQNLQPWEVSQPLYKSLQASQKEFFDGTGEFLPSLVCVQMNGGDLILYVFDINSTQVCEILGSHTTVDSFTSQINEHDVSLGGIRKDFAVLSFNKYCTPFEQLLTQL